MLGGAQRVTVLSPVPHSHPTDRSENATRRKKSSIQCRSGPSKKNKRWRGQGKSIQGYAAFLEDHSRRSLDKGNRCLHAEREGKTYIERKCRSISLARWPCWLERERERARATVARPCAGDATTRRWCRAAGMDHVTSAASLAWRCCCCCCFDATAVASFGSVLVGSVCDRV